MTRSREPLALTPERVPLTQSWSSKPSHLPESLAKPVLVAMRQLVAAWFVSELVMALALKSAVRWPAPVRAGGSDWLLLPYHQSAGLPPHWPADTR